MIFEVKENNEKVLATVSGRLDTPSAVSAQQEITPLLENADKEIILDCTELEYISSAGLRFFMQLKRDSETQGGTIRVTHLNEDVADIFRMSGFQNIFDIA